MTTWFVTGTDTEVGKTIFTNCFNQFLTNHNQQVTTQKWVQTGCKEIPLDIDKHDQSISTPQSKSIRKFRMPYSFSLPASAHLAAKNENTIIDPNKIIQSLRYLENQFDNVIIEGLGGIAVPLTETQTTLDILEQLKPHIIIVIPNQIGAINHALLTIETISNRHIPISGFIINNLNPKTPNLIKDDNPKIIQTLSGIKCIGTINQTKQLQLSQPFIHQELNIKTNQ
mgnify:CR=1 FL=1|tara:strand:+ start:22709 stop:23389 length:681 start_codon:yes stop_codon:yes gene_type:complete